MPGEPCWAWKPISPTLTLGTWKVSPTLGASSSGPILPRTSSSGPPVLSEPSVLPTPPRCAIEKIQSGEFVELEEFLPENFSSGQEPIQLVTAGGNMAQLSLNLRTKHKRAIKNFSAWLEAWTTYMGIVVSARSDRAHEIICYQHIVCAVNHQFTTSAVLNYNRAFRQHTEKQGTALRRDQPRSIHLLRSPRPPCT